ncbi:MAG: M20/M25/M40 family metallo-hydrolase [Coriobacteriia bacterium]|nr:M20/M25/M40 family metallo-hydrolase [Coriobacteriia bacterium]
MDPVLIVIIVLGIIIVAIIALVAVVLIRTLTFKPPTFSGESIPDWQPEEMPDAVVARLQAAIQIPTVSAEASSAVGSKVFREFLTFLKESYPLFHQQTSLEVINNFSLIYRWKGSGEGLLPSAFLAHYDVVPIETGTEGDWQYPPFSGALVDETVWGRGTLDIKSQLTAYLEAAELLMAQGFKPARDLYFCFGHDEEICGRDGAALIVEHLASLGIRFESVLDEGGLVITGAMKGVRPPLALIGIAEKGSADYRISVPGAGGHSSMPPQHTALGLAARLITLIEENPLPPRLTPSVELLLRNIAGELGFMIRMALANLWLFRPLILSILAKNPVTNAMIRSTFAVTMAQASDAPNVLPQTANITVNVRLLPGDTIKGVGQHFEKLAVAAGLESARIELPIDNEASEASLTDAPFLKLMERLIGEFYPSAISTPYLVMGATDSRYYTKLSSQVYRLTPIHVSDAERELVHNTNERIDLPNYFRMIQFFQRLFQEL